MLGGHMCNESTVANLMALWVARDLKGIDTVVASKASHISIDKAAKILNMKLIGIDIKKDGLINEKLLPELHQALLKIKQIEVFQKPIMGIVLFRPKNMDVNEFLSKFPRGVFFM